MGGSGEFTWDLTFTANVLSLLDPTATKEVLRFIIASTDLSLPFPGWPHPWLVPQSWDGNSAGLGPNATYSGGSEYRFDYYAAFVFVSTYVRVTNDTAFLSEQITDHTPGPPTTSKCDINGNWSCGPPSNPPIELVTSDGGKRVEAHWNGSWHFANGTVRRDKRGHTFVSLGLRANRTAKVFQNLTAVVRDDCDVLWWDSSSAYQRVGSTLPPPTSVTVRDYLRALAVSHRQFNATPGHPHLTDFGGDKRFYLEMVPTYIHALPSLQFGKAFMLLSLAELEPTLAQEATAEADATIEEAVKAMYVEGEGVWACVYPNGTRMPVRTVADFAYIGRKMRRLSRFPCTRVTNLGSISPSQRAWGRCSLRQRAAMASARRRSPTSCGKGWASLPGRSSGCRSRTGSSRSRPRTRSTRRPTSSSGGPTGAPAARTAGFRAWWRRGWRLLMATLPARRSCCPPVV